MLPRCRARFTPPNPLLAARCPASKPACPSTLASKVNSVRVTKSTFTSNRICTSMNREYPAIFGGKQHKGLLYAFSAVYHILLCFLQPETRLSPPPLLTLSKTFELLVFKILWFLGSQHGCRDAACCGCGVAGMGGCGRSWRKEVQARGCGRGHFPSSLASS